MDKHLFKWLAVLSMAALCEAVPLAGPLRQCAGGLEHGARVEMPDYYYECVNGSLVNRGCFAPDKTPLAANQTHVFNGVVFACLQYPGGLLQLRMAGCVQDGRIHMVNDVWQTEDELWYFCEPMGFTLKLQFGGCVFEGRRISRNTQEVRDSVVYECREETENSSAGMHAVGCMHYAHKYAIGETFEDPHFSYMCARLDESRVVTRVVACVTPAKVRLTDGQRYMHSGSIYECVLGVNTARHRPVGCVTERGLKKVGQSWSAGFAPYKYQQECRLDKDDNRATVAAVACVFVDGLGQEHRIEVGCYHLLDGEAVACKRRKADGKLVYNVFSQQVAEFAEVFEVQRCDEDDNSIRRLA